MNLIYKINLFLSYHPEIMTAVELISIATMAWLGWKNKLIRCAWIIVAVWVAFLAYWSGLS